MTTTTDRQDQSYNVLRKRKTRRFAMKAFKIFAVVHLYVGWRLLPDLPIGLTAQIFGGALLILTTFLIPFGTLGRVYLRDQEMIDRLNWAGGVTMGWFSSLLILTIARDLALVVPATRAWTPESAVLVLALSVVLTGIGFLNARRVTNMARIDIPIKDLPAALDGFTIAQITDLHIGPTIKRKFVEGVVRQVNGLNADMIAITGDIVDGYVSHLANDTAPLAQLKSRYGAFYVTGNHEYFYGADDWIAAFRGLGLHPLENSHVVINHNGAKLVVAGIHDYTANHSNHHHVSDAKAALAGSPDGAPKIMLAHQPRSATLIEPAGADLQLSGHTHGGQIWPWNYLVRLQQPFTAGLHRHGKLWVYISRGSGYWGPPKRLGAPSEITLLTLKRD